MGHNHPNFPDKLKIQPLILPCEKRHVFDADAQRESIKTYGIAGRVWEAAYLMTIYLDNVSSWEFNPPLIDEMSARKRVFLELGSGTGIVAAKITQMAALSGRDLVIATDLPEVCPLLERNLFIKPKGSSPFVLVRSLPWGSHNHAMQIAQELGLIDVPVEGERACITHIICSDIVYFPELLAPLLRTLLHLTSPPFVSTSDSQPRVTMSYQVRSLSKESPFWSAFGLWFSFEPVVARRIDANESSTEWQWFRIDDQMFIFVAHRRPESVNWIIPSEDTDLLDGSGAWGTNSKKSDAKFETLLLMGLGGE